MLKYRLMCVKNNTLVNRKRYESGGWQTFVSPRPDLAVAAFPPEFEEFWPAGDFSATRVVTAP
jgi:hypothetical protein